MYSKILEMCVGRILEEKKRLNLSTKTIVDTSALHLSKDTVSRILALETSNPGIETLVCMGDTVGLKPYEMFMDAETAAEFRAYQEFERSSDEAAAELVRVAAENETLKTTNAGLADRLRVLEMTTEHQQEKIALMEELLAMYRETRKPNVLTLSTL